MIDKNRLIKFSRLKGLSLGNCEKDYLLDLALFIISRSTKDELIFKGGTALYKFHNLDRFSEDLDFTAKTEFNTDLLFNKILSHLKLFGIDSNLQSLKKVHCSILATIRTKGPLYNGSQNTLSKIQIDINFKSGLQKQPENLKHISTYGEIAAFDLLVMDLEEIFAEKVRALITRSKARDLYDLWFLMKKGTTANSKFIQEKLDYYGEKYTKTKFVEGIKQKEKIWKTEMRYLIKDVPNFNDVKSELMKSIPN
ncbi:MAG: nucleotidyl transferase AbiEii/AbiGii toxin family protein [Nanoarchaeota archaeon]|nr:nucleotidyl transferase AbiEii/AbiGii toxin family protein [Nanoarchaeota archaeon]